MVTVATGNKAATAVGLATLASPHLPYPPDTAVLPKNQTTPDRLRADTITINPAVTLMAVAKHTAAVTQSAAKHQRPGGKCRNEQSTGNTFGRIPESRKCSLKHN